MAVGITALQQGLQTARKAEGTRDLQQQWFHRLEIPRRQKDTPLSETEGTNIRRVPRKDAVSLARASGKRRSFV